MKRLLTLLLVLPSLLGLAACSDDEGSDQSSSSDIAESEEFNQADVDFATAMIPHHAQALAMVDVTVGRDLSPELTQLAARIREANNQFLGDGVGSYRAASTRAGETAGAR